MPILKRNTISTILILLMLLTVGIFWLRSSLPTLDGHIYVQGPEAPIHIIRDTHGVPHIYGNRETDSYFGLGFVHAQDRLWQIELGRMAGAGRLSEIFGERTVNLDKYLRGLGFYKAATLSLNHFDSESIALINAYTKGVNAYLTHRSGALPIEFVLFNHVPEQWTAADSIVSAKMMAQKLGGNAHEELIRQKLSQELSQDQINDLWPPYAGNTRRSTTGVEITNISGNIIPNLLTFLPTPISSKVGSNNWATSGQHTATGKPIVASDPHLGLTAPSPWYLAHLSAPNLNIVGATIPGIPVIIVGRNNNLAWGVTNTGPDVQDLFIEKIQENNSDKYLTNYGSDFFRIRTETIKVKNSENIQMSIRETYHGPVISDFSKRHSEILKEKQAMSLSWTALASDDTTIQAGFNLAQADTWTEMKNALRDFVSPQQNFVGADTSGNIFFIAPGRIPIRKEMDGWFPSKGWTGQGDWVDFIPFEELPNELNPATGKIVTANQKIVPPGYPHFITHDWASPYRYNRIIELLTNLSNHTVSDYKLIQTDVQSLMANDFLPILLSEKSLNGSHTLSESLSTWDGAMEPEAKEPLIFHAWYRELTKLVYGDELGQSFDLIWSRRPNFMYKTLTENQTWCDDVNTPQFETCAKQILLARDMALLWLEDNYGENQNKWIWGKAHKARHRHQALSRVSIVGRIFDIIQEHGGGPYTVMQANTTISRTDAPFEENHGAALRAIFDLSEPDATHLMISTGQSGNIFSEHYRDLSRDWVNNKWIIVPTTDKTVRGRARHTLILNPINK